MKPPSLFLVGAAVVVVFVALSAFFRWANNSEALETFSRRVCDYTGGPGPLFLILIVVALILVNAFGDSK